MRLLLLCALLIFFVDLTGAQEYGFRHLSKDDGISHDQINDIYQDSEGFMWISTAWGLNRYDGYRAKQYHCATTDSTTIRNNFVQWTRDIANHKMYVRTATGDCIYDKTTDTFSYDVAKYVPAGGYEGAIQTYVDQHHNVWVANNNDLYVSINSETELILVTPTLAIESEITGITENNHQLVFATKEGQIGAVDLSNFDTTLRGGIVAEITKSTLAEGRNKPFIDNEGEFWFVNRDALGLWRYTPRTNKWSYYNDSPNSQYNIPAYLIRQIAQDKSGILWFVTDHAGVILIDKKEEKTTVLRHKETDARSICSDALNCIFCDYNGTIWIGYYQTGFSYYNPSNFKFGVDRLGQLKRLDPGFVSNITTITDDGNGHIWMGTNGSGLACIDLNNENNCKIYRHNPKDDNSLPSDVIVDLEITKDGNLWIGTYLGGLSIFDGKKFTNFKDKANIPAAVSCQNIWSIQQTKNETVWVGSLTKGIAAYDPKTKKFTEYTRENDHLISDYAGCMEPIANSNSLYIGTERGIYLISSNSTNPNIREIDSDNQFPILHEQIHDLLEDSRGLLWAGTRGGLCVYNPVENTCKEFKIHSSNINGYVSAIEEDNMHNIWATTAEGLTYIRVTPTPAQELPYRFDQYKYTKDDGLEDGTYNHRSMHKLPDGRVLIGRSFGLSHFMPNNLHLNQEPPEVYFTLLRIFGEEAKPLKTIYDAMPLQKQLYLSKEGLELPSSASMFTVEFSTLNYILTHKTTYTYRLEGLSDNRIVTNKAEATFTNLLPGNYTLYVTATNADGYTNNHEYALPIRILPPWYASTIAFVIYLLLFVLFAWCAVQTCIFLMQTKYEKHSKYDQEIRNGIMQEQKEKLFSNISRDFDEPIKEMIQPLQSLREKAGENCMEEIDQIEKNAKRIQESMAHILNLDIVSSSKKRLNPERLDIVAHIKQLYKTFENKESQDIEYTFYSSQPNIIMDFDPEKISTAISQIITNASKYTPAFGQISLSIEAQPESVSIIITDTGVGISKKYKKHLFDKFYQTPSADNNSGYGIGLHVANELIKMHNGTISAEDNPSGQGSQFVIVLPYVQSGTVMNDDNTSFISEKPDENDKDLIENAKKQIEENILTDFSVEDLARNLRISRVQLYKKITSYTGKTPVEFIRQVRLHHAAELLKWQKKSIYDIAKSSGFSNVDYFEQYFKEEFGASPEEYRLRQQL